MRVTPDILFSISTHHKKAFRAFVVSTISHFVEYIVEKVVDASVVDQVFTISGRLKVLHPPYVIAKLCVGDPKHEESMKGRIAMYFFIILII